MFDTVHAVEWDGEEFVLPPPATDQQAALDKAERCRKLLKQKEIPHARSGIGRVVTVSMGGGAIAPGARDAPPMSSSTASTAASIRRSPRAATGSATPRPEGRGMRFP